MCYTWVHIWVWTSDVFSGESVLFSYCGIQGSNTGHPQAFLPNVNTHWATCPLILFSFSLWCINNSRLVDAPTVFPGYHPKTVTQWAFCFSCTTMHWRFSYVYSCFMRNFFVSIPFLISFLSGWHMLELCEKKKSQLRKCTTQLPNRQVCELCCLN